MSQVALAVAPASLDLGGTDATVIAIRPKKPNLLAPSSAPGKSFADLYGSAPAPATAPVMVGRGRIAPIPSDIPCLGEIVEDVTETTEVAEMSGEDDYVEPPKGPGTISKVDLTKEKKPVAEANGRVIIKIGVGDIEEVVTKSEAALRDAKLGVYQRTGFLCYVGFNVGRDSRGREHRAQVIHRIGDYDLLAKLSSAAMYETWDGRRNEMAIVNPKLDIAKTMLQRVGRYTLPSLAGIANAPTLREDGSIIQVEGFDERMGLLVDYCGATFPTIPETPTKEQAKAALKVLTDLLVGFPFLERHHRSVALSMLLTACIRKSMPTCPMHGISASTPGSGKSLLQDLASILLNGDSASTANWTGDISEDRKSLGAMLLQGDQAIPLDNVDPGLVVGGTFLNSLLTTSQVSVRILGQSSQPKVQTNAMLTATGNNLTFSADMVRRVLLCILETNLEHPELREFDFNPADKMMASRGEYVAACLTILRAHHVAGRPAHGRTKLAGFEVWDQWVRASLIWLGEADPLVSQAEVEALDPEKQKHAGLLATWNQAIGNQRMTCSAIVAHANSRLPTGIDDEGNETGGGLAHPAFREAMLDVASSGPDRLDPKKLGQFLKSVAGRIVAGRCFAKGKMLDGIATWELQTSKGAKGF